MKGYIYSITNKTCGYIYIGKAKDIKKRWAGHSSSLDSDCHQNTFLQRDWNIFGKEDFLFEIVEECEIEKMDEREKWWIEYHGSKPFIYNRTPKRLLSKGTRILVLKECRKISKKRRDMVADYYRGQVEIGKAERFKVGKQWHYHFIEG